MEQDHASTVAKPVRVPWNKGKLVGAKPPLRPDVVGGASCAVDCNEANGSYWG